MKLLAVLAVFFLVQRQATAFTPLADTERKALVELYEATNGENWEFNSNWLIGDPCENQWYGIECGKDDQGKPSVFGM